MRSLQLLCLFGIMLGASCNQLKAAKESAVLAFNNRHLLCGDTKLFAQKLFPSFKEYCLAENVNVSARVFESFIEKDCADMKIALSVYKTVEETIKAHTKSMMKMECGIYQQQAAHKEI